MITRKLRTLLYTAAGAAFLAAVPVSAADPLMTPERLQALERNADTPSEHASIAKQYRLRAEAMEQKAIEHEANVRQRTQAMGAMAHKWPGMASGAVHKEKEQAMEARRAARESRELAQRHLGLSIEALAEDTSHPRPEVNR